MDEPREPTRRELQRARVRCAMLLALEERLRTDRLEDIGVDEIADAGGVSRMTFFNHFGSKENALDLLAVMLSMRLAQAVRRRGARGIAGVEVVFAEMGAYHAESPSRGRRLMAHFATRQVEEPMPELEPAELQLLGLELPEGSRASGLGSLFIRLLDEARGDGELQARGSSYQLGHYLGALLLGSSIVGHSNPNLDWAAMFRAHGRRTARMLRTAEPTARTEGERARRTTDEAQRTSTRAAKRG